MTPSNPGAVTPGDLLQACLDVIDHWPNEHPDAGYDSRPQHPQDAWSTASVILETITADRIAEWERHRSTATTT